MDPVASFLLSDLSALLDFIAPVTGLSTGRMRALARPTAAPRYRHIKLPKKQHGSRRISTPLDDLKALQAAVLRYVLSGLPVHEAVHGFVPGRSLVSFASPHVGRCMVISLDIADFFASIKEAAVRRVLRRNSVERTVQKHLLGWCVEDDCLPQGAPTSPILANAVVYDMDEALSKMGFIYTRYGDDLAFGTDQYLSCVVRREFMKDVSQIVQRHDLQLRESKTTVGCPSNGTCRLGGVVVGTASLRAPRGLKRRLRAAMHQHRTGKARAWSWSMEQIMGTVAFLDMVEGPRE